MTTTPPVYRCIVVEQVGDIFVAQLREGGLDRTNVHELGRELLSLIEREDCRKLVVRFGPSECLYSALMAQLLAVRRQIQERSGHMKLCEVPPLTRDVFRVCKLESLFEFAPDLEYALRDW